MNNSAEDGHGQMSAGMIGGKTVGRDIVIFMCTRARNRSLVRGGWMRMLGRGGGSRSPMETEQTKKKIEKCIKKKVTGLAKYG